METKEFLISLLLFISGCVAGQPIPFPRLTVPLPIEKNTNGDHNVVVIDMEAKKIMGRWYAPGGQPTEITISPVEAFSLGSSIDYILKDISNPEELNFIIKGNKQEHIVFFDTVMRYFTSNHISNFKQITTKQNGH